MENDYDYKNTETKLAIFKDRIGLPVQNAQPELLLLPLRPAIQAKEPSPIINKNINFN
jgi:hypothetical protein